jgi:hypothetical protein
MKDASITSAMQTELISDRLSNMSHIDVDTERGVVNLNGVVETEGQRARAARLAHHVEGVVRVNNNLQIQVKEPNPAHAQDKKVSQPDRTKSQEVNILQGDVLRVEHNNIIIQPSNGREVRVHFDENTEMTGYIGPGEHIEAKVNEQRHALSVRQLQ